jgi:hypothetical protein
MESCIKALVRLKEPWGTYQDGRMFLVVDDIEVYRPVIYLDQSACEHTFTMCDDCVSSWADDHDVILTEAATS